VELLLGLQHERNFLKNSSPRTGAFQMKQGSPESDHVPSYSEAASGQDIKSIHSLYKDMRLPPVPEPLTPPDAQTTPKPLQLQSFAPDLRSTKEVNIDSTMSPGLKEENTSAVGASSDSAGPVKKTRRIKPQVQAEVCAECGKLQREIDDEDEIISWISCNGCNRWFHANCVGFRGKAEARSVDKFVCKKCEPEHGQTTFVRTSSRARTAIDYAGLNQGLIKSSIESSMHHYIQPIKTGKFQVQPDDFARVRPELLTVEFMESFDNMKRPFVVPASWNPRFGAPRKSEPESLDPGRSIVEDRLDDAGKTETAAILAQPDTETDPVVDCDQDLLDMVMPRDLTVRKVAEIYGSQELVPVIDVKTQETRGSWTLQQWADYYEETGEKPIRNVISLEVSESPLGRLIRRPRVVRELDLEDEVWDSESRANQKKRPVQYYCLMSVADSYTDFHIDFGGSSVYYHILKGTKTFFFIPPEDRYLKKYEEWCNSQSQNDTWLPDLCNNSVTRVDLHEGDTAFIPAGWIHSVWTPEDSLVIGGNYLTRIDYELQLKVANVEKATKVAPKFRYPFFQKVMWFALIKYLDDDPVPEEILHDFHDDSDYTHLRPNPVWHEFGDLANESEPGSAEYNARYYPKSEIKGLVPLRDYLYRTARIHADLPVPDINKRQIEAVKNSIPKGYGDPLIMVKTFAIWCAWKIGNVIAPDWVHTDAGGFPELEKKSKKQETLRVPGERSSLRRATQGPDAPEIEVASSRATPEPNKKHKILLPKASAARTACDACRKRRVRCPHREPGSPSSRSQSPTLAPVINGMAGPDLAQPILADLDASVHDSNGGLGFGNGPSSGKKSRSKACEECRKSKVRTQTW
jgi:F-box/leucine-rich repeat protein 10/11